MVKFKTFRRKLDFFKKQFQKIQILVQNGPRRILVSVRPGPARDKSEMSSIWFQNVSSFSLSIKVFFRTFPIDQQRCMLFYESFTHNSDQVKMDWITTVPPITILKGNITLPDYVLVDFSASSELRVSFLNIDFRKSFLSLVPALPTRYFQRTNRHVYLPTTIRFLYSPSLCSCLHFCIHLMGIIHVGCWTNTIKDYCRS